MFKRLADEAVIADKAFITVDKRLLELCEDKARDSVRKRYRLCAHQDLQDQIHEMLICLERSSYIRPHKHQGKSESLHVIAGRAQLLLFDLHGEITDIIPLGPFESGEKFYYRMAEPIYHSLLVETDFFVFHEVTSGPLDPSQTVYADWAPVEGTPTAKIYELSLRKKLGE